MYSDVQLTSNMVHNGWTDRQMDRQTDGWMDGRTDKKSDILRWHTEVGAPPNNLGMWKTACLKGFISALGLQ